jgi:4-diphosphocytidyl-2-C-methyl-D-erythritol kinase
MPPDARTVHRLCPAKLNLSLAILGKQADGFHALHSVVAQVGLADELEMTWSPHGYPAEDSVQVDGADLPCSDNTVATAIRLFREAAGVSDGSFTARLEKRIPAGAGLGGGSSDGVGALRALKALLGRSDLDLQGMAAAIGSDCPLFLEDDPVVMEGRGERIRPLPEKVGQRFRGKPVVLFKPYFPINTAEAYRRLALYGFYQEEAAIPGQMETWMAGEEPLPPRNNDFERLVELWIPGLAVVLTRLREVHGLDARMSGSGSACFVFPNGQPFARNLVAGEIQRAFGGQYWIEETVFN